ncbi:hypothetical protein HMJ29_17465 [Hymenobacter taeanensis]|uniref:Uncharacterized protein n=1 Tax=Hymenobacter taeanensis TaxID=2735321 RepID=A0A6M6BKW7_9BACT|nr:MULTISPECIES: hypothetical protein [Hymenobacter]QJX48609.1 hypothetical protein HMJ29_17465 [Hymenobacter taeanensis]UOQ81892.1 hypothetical protein MUN83_03625 [Hymenobacter sp. 5414T-23]
MPPIQFIPPDATAAQKKKLQADFNRHLADPAVQREMAEANKPATRVIAEETVQGVSSEQWQHFEQVFKNGFHHLPAYGSNTRMNDGAYWLLEAHQADGYHMVFRHSPAKTDDFRRACEYLLDISSARNEERY